jgi:hypothetical protein
VKFIFQHAGQFDLSREPIRVSLGRIEAKRPLEVWLPRTRVAAETGSDAEAADMMSGFHAVIRASAHRSAMPFHPR